MSNNESRENVNRGVCVEKLKSIRENFNWKKKNSPRKLFNLISPLIREWHGPYPNLREIFRPKEIDLLLKYAYFEYEMDDDTVVFLEFLINAGYKDEPEVDGEVDDDGKPLLRRTTLIHHEEDQTWLLQLFKIYDRFDLNFVDESGYTHFHVACEFGCNDAVRRFLEHGEDPNLLVPETGDSPLHMAVTNHHETAARLLLEGGANPNLANLNGWTPLHYICKMNGEQGHEDDDYAELFLKINDDIQQTVQIDAQDKKGNTPLHMALDYGLVITSKILLRRGADPNIVNAEGLTPLHVICKRDYNDDLMKMFLNINEEKNQVVQIDARDKKGRTPLQYAVANFGPRMVELLLDHGADLSGFVFPSKSDFEEKYDLRIGNYDSIIQLRLTSGLLACVELLEKKGYQLDRNDALTIMNLFAEQNVFEQPTEFDQSWYDDESFARETKETKVRPGLSLYDFIRSPPEEATELLTYMEYFDFAQIILPQYYRIPHFEASIAHLCEMSSRRFFRRWALDPLMELTHYRLSILRCEMIIKPLMNEDLYLICLAAAGQTS